MQVIKQIDQDEVQCKVFYMPLCFTGELTEYSTKFMFETPERCRESFPWQVVVEVTLHV